MARRTGALELAVLGFLHDAPMHGYELRKQVNALLGWGRAFSYGTLYPCLKALVRAGYLVEQHTTDTPAPSARGGRRARIVYHLTDAGRAHFEQLLSEAGPSAWEDEHFGVHFAFFGRADTDTRIRILEGRRSRLQERLEKLRTALARTRERLDTYTLELQRHGLESVELEVRWLDGLISAERSTRATSARHESAVRESPAHESAAQEENANPSRTDPDTPDSDPVAPERKRNT
ncbi:MAG TPA: PadR family transcriptional regulator [Jiangellaceae bacterium]|nr:PadR family transcriptional regulator [Jiangellaceae bacterium]